MFKRAAITLLFTLLSTSLLLAQAFGKQKKSTKITKLFTVNKTPVTVDEFIYLYKKNHQDKKDFTAEKIDQYLDLFINFKLKVEEAKNRGLDTTKIFLKEYHGYMEELRKPYLPDAKMVDSLVALTYDRLHDEIKAYHILIALKPDAVPADTLTAFNKIVELRKRIVSGEDFGNVAFSNSNDPSAKVNQGNLGYFTAMQMVYPFETAAYTTAVGDVSQPVRSRFGYHLLKVTDRRPARGEVEVSHIMIRVTDSKAADKVKNEIFNVHDQLQAGVNWEELCQQYSDDINTKDSGGKLKPFGTGAMAAVPEFERIAFSLQKPGEISDPFQTQYGWHILRLEQKIPLQSFQELQSSLKTRVARDERTELSKKDLQNKLRRDYQYVEMPDSKSKLTELADSTLQSGKWNPTVASTVAEATLFTLSGKKYSIKDFITHTKRNQRSSTLEPKKYLDQLYDEFVDSSIIELFEKRIMEEHPEYKFLLREYYEGILLFDIMEKEVWSRASQDSAGQQSYYAAHRADFVTGERAKVTLYSSKNADFRTPLRELIVDSAVSAIEDFATKHKIKAESGYFKKDEKELLQKLPWAPGVYPTENSGMYYLAWLKDILPAGPMSFEEARPAIISDYQAFLEKNWVIQLKKKYRVRVNEKGQQYILQKLQTAG